MPSRAKCYGDVVQSDVERNFGRSTYEINILKHFTIDTLPIGMDIFDVFFFQNFGTPEISKATPGTTKVNAFS